MMDVAFNEDEGTLIIRFRDKNLAKNVYEFISIVKPILQFIDADIKMDNEGTVIIKNVDKEGATMFFSLVETLKDLYNRQKKLERIAKIAGTAKIELPNISEREMDELYFFVTYIDLLSKAIGLIERVVVSMKYEGIDTYELEEAKRLIERTIEKLKKEFKR